MNRRNKMISILAGVMAAVLVLGLVSSALLILIG